MARKYPNMPKMVYAVQIESQLMTFIERSQPKEYPDASDVARTFTAELEYLRQSHKSTSKVLHDFQKHTAERLRTEMQTFQESDEGRKEKFIHELGSLVSELKALQKRNPLLFMPTDYWHLDAAHHDLAKILKGESR